MTLPRVPIEIHTILTTYRATATRSGSDGQAEARALARLDEVALKIDAERDHELQALLDAARDQVRARAY